LGLGKYWNVIIARYGADVLEGGKLINIPSKIVYWDKGIL